MNEHAASASARPAVTVVIPTFNRAAIVVRAIRSVLGQTCQDWELIVVDDCSTDGTEQAVRSFSDSRIKYIRHDRNRLAGAARNTGMRCARGEYVAFLDSDDEWPPEKLQKELDVFRNSDPAVDLVYSGMLVLSETGRVLEIRIPTKSGWAYKALLDSNCIGSSSLITAKKQTLERVAGFDETLVSHQDWDLCLRVARVSRIAPVPHCLVKRHLGHDQMSRSLRRICEGRERFFQKHRSEMKPRTVALHLSRIALMLFNYEPRRARALAWEGLRLRPLQPLLVGGLAASIFGMEFYRWLFLKMAKWQGGSYLGQARI